MFYVLLAASFISLFTFLWTIRRPRNFPPGSSPFSAGPHAHFTMDTWRDRYGPLVGLMLGPKPAVAVVEARTVMEVLRHEDFQGRPKADVIKDIRRLTLDGEFLGVFFSDGSYWSEQRRFTSRILKEFGFGKRSMEGLILEEAEAMVDEIRRGSPKTVQVSRLFVVSVINVLWSVMAGVRHARDDADFRRLMETLNKQYRGGDATHSGVLNTIPWLRQLFPSHREQLKIQRDLHDFMKSAIREHEKTYDADVMRDFIDVYIRQMQLGKPASGFHEQSLIAVCLDLFGAGSESVSNTIGFCLLYLVRHPEVQARIRDELDGVVGRSRRVSLNDRSNLVYLEAFLYEVMRINPIGPLSVPHRATRDTTLKGYSIPKNTMMMISLWSCCHDVTHWGDPHNFRPERHIDVDGKLFKDDFLVNFGVGKRGCLGEALARNTMFLFLATMLQEVDFVLPQGHELPSTTSLPGFVVAPRPFEVLVVERA